MKLSPLDIQHKTFTKSFLNGYNQEQVQAFLARIAEQVDDLMSENKKLSDELNSKTTIIEELQTGELELKRAVTAAERIGNEMKNNARREAQLVIKDAEQRKDLILREAQQRYRDLSAELVRLERERDLFREQFRGMLRAFERSIDAVPVSQENMAPSQSAAQAKSTADTPQPG